MGPYPCMWGPWGIVSRDLLPPAWRSARVLSGTRAVPGTPDVCLARETKQAERKMDVLLPSSTAPLPPRLVTVSPARHSLQMSHRGATGSAGNGCWGCVSALQSRELGAVPKKQQQGRGREGGQQLPGANPASASRAGSLFGVNGNSLRRRAQPHVMLKGNSVKRNANPTRTGADGLAAVLPAGRGAQGPAGSLLCPGAAPSQHLPSCFAPIAARDDPDGAVRGVTWAALLGSPCLVALLSLQRAAWGGVGSSSPCTPCCRQPSSFLPAAPRLPGPVPRTRCCVLRGPAAPTRPY